MKSLLRVMLSMAFSFFLHENIQAENVISLSEAIQKRWVKVSLKGTGDVEGLNNNSHEGKCIRIKITNISGRALKVQLKAGQFLQPEDSSTQRMLVTNTMLFALNNGAFRNDYITAFCSQMSNGSPRKDLDYAVSRMSDGNVYDLAQIIDKYDFVSSNVQSAVWAFTDNKSIPKFTSNDTFEDRILNTFIQERKFVLNEPPLFIEDEPELEASKRNATSSVIYDLNLGNRYKIQVTVTDKNGMIVKTLFPEPKHYEPGNLHLEMKLNSNELPEGEYMVKLLMNNQVTMQKSIRLGNSDR